MHNRDSGGDEAAGSRWSRIVEQIRAGDDAGQQALYDAFGRGLRLYFAMELRTADVDDKVHDTFVAVVSAIRAGALQDPVRLAGYVRGVAHNQAAAYVARMLQSRGRTGELFEDLPVADRGPDPEQKTLSGEERILVHEILQRLSATDREILVRFYLQEQTAEQIRHDLKLDDTQFRLRKHRAKKHFSAALGKALKRQRITGKFLLRKKAACGH